MAIASMCPARHVGLFFRFSKLCACVCVFLCCAFTCVVRRGELVIQPACILDVFVETVHSPSVPWAVEGVWIPVAVCQVCA